MSALSERARAEAKTKVGKLTRVDPKERVDASGYTPSGALDADLQTGPRPISRRAFKRGGKILGEVLKARADRKPRATGGVALVNDFVNRNAKDANPGEHVGGYAAGGRIGKMGGGGFQRPVMTPGAAAMPGTTTMAQRPVMRRASGGKVHEDEAQDRALIHKMGCRCAKCWGGRTGKAKGGSVSDGTMEGMRPEGGRLARAKGGRTKTKKGTNINIIIAPAGGGAPRPMMPPPGAPPGGPLGLHQGPPLSAGAPGAMPPGAPAPMGPQAPAPLARKDGGGVVGHLAKPGKYPIKHASGGGKGRLEKIQAYG